MVAPACRGCASSASSPGSRELEARSEGLAQSGFTFETRFAKIELPPVGGQAVY
jgi:hypothetical protein